MQYRLNEWRNRKVSMSISSEELLSYIAELTKLVSQQREEIAELRQLITSRHQHTTTGLASQTIPRKRFLRGLAAGLFVGTAATTTMLTSTKEAQAKLAINTNPQIGVIATLQGVGITGAAINPDNRYGFVASSKQTTLNLSNDLPLESDCGVVGISGSGAGVWGKVADGWGVRGEVATGGFGVTGLATTVGTGVAGASSEGFGVSAQSMNGIPLFVQPSAATPTLPADVTAGAIYFDPNGNMYISQGTAWKKVAIVP
jgi:hypothetical protein